MASLPRISIITPSYNQAVFLEETFSSFLAQGYPDLELIVVDGGSTDGSVEVIRKYANHIKWWCSEKDKGQTDAIIKGLQHCSGEIITWINSDDTLEHGALKAVAGYFSNPAIQAVCGRTRIFGEGRNRIALPSLRKGETVQDALCRFNFNQQGTFYRKTAIDKMGLPRAELHYVMDKEWWNRFLLTHDVLHVAITEDVFAGFRIHNLSKSGTDTSKFNVEYAAVLAGYCRMRNLQHDLEILTRLFPDIKGRDFIPEGPVPGEDLAHRMVVCFLLKKLHSVYTSKDFERAAELREFIRKYPVNTDAEHREYAMDIEKLSSWTMFRVKRKWKQIFGS